MPWELCQFDNIADAVHEGDFWSCKSCEKEKRGNMRLNTFEKVGVNIADVIHMVNQVKEGRKKII